MFDEFSVRAIHRPPVSSVLRQSSRDDIHGMHRVRLSVTENQLTSTVITEPDYVAAIETTGRGWVIESDGEIVAFAVGNAHTGNIWALFVEPGYEHHGYGRRLHDVTVEWLWSQRLTRLWLTTTPGTRAAHFYRTAGWREVGRTAGGELTFELHAPDRSAKPG